MTIALSPRTRQRLAGWTCVLSYAWALLAPIAHAGRVLPLEGTGRYTQRDALNRPLTITDDGGTPSTTADDRVTTYGYDLAGRALTLTQPNGTRSVNTYDKAGRLKTRTLKAPNNSTLAVFSWQYDALGNVKQQTEDWLPGATSSTARQRSTDMSYDDGGRLWTETVTETGAATVTTTYTYDAAHNRKRKVVTGGTGAGTWDMDYNSYNQLISMTKTVSGSVTETVTYSYDLNGNRTQSRRVVGTDWSKITIYRWNAWDKLIGVQMPDTRAYTYTYDYRTRRVGTAQDDTMGLVAKHTAVVFSGGLSVAEFERATNTALNSAVPAVQYMRGPDMGGGVGGLLFTVRNPVNNSGWPVPPTAASPLMLRHNLSNGRGDIVAQSDSTGALTWTASYEAYGKRTKETGTNADKQRANTKDEDPTGLLNEGFRYRDIETGVWLSRDPAGFVDGPNLYAYVSQNPWSKFDPDGLTGWALPPQYAQSAEYREGFHKGMAEGAKIGLVMTVGVGVTIATGGLATAASAAVFGSGTVATSLSAAALSGAAGSIAANSTGNVLNGKSIGKGTIKAGITGAAFGAGGQLLGNTALAFKQGMAEGTGMAAKATALQNAAIASCVENQATSGAAGGLVTNRAVATGASVNGNQCYAAAADLRVAAAMDATPAAIRSDYHMNCAEPQMATNLLRAGGQTEGAVSSVGVIAPGSPYHGMAKPPCSYSCQEFNGRMGIIDMNAKAAWSGPGKNGGSAGVVATARETTEREKENK